MFGGRYPPLHERGRISARTPSSQASCFRCRNGSTRHCRCCLSRSTSLSACGIPSPCACGRRRTATTSPAPGLQLQLRSVSYQSLPSLKPMQADLNSTLRTTAPARSGRKVPEGAVEAGLAASVAAMGSYERIAVTEFFHGFCPVGMASPALVLVGEGELRRHRERRSCQCNCDRFHVFVSRIWPLWQGRLGYFIQKNYPRFPLCQATVMRHIVADCDLAPEVPFPSEAVPLGRTPRRSAGTTVGSRPCQASGAPPSRPAPGQPLAMMAPGR